MLEIAQAFAKASGKKIPYSVARYMKLMQTCCSFPNSSMLVESLESLQRSIAVNSLGVNSDLAGPIFVKSLKFNIQVDFLVHKLNLKSLWKACGF